MGRNIIKVVLRTKTPRVYLDYAGDFYENDR